MDDVVSQLKSAYDASGIADVLDGVKMIMPGIVTAYSNRNDNFLKLHGNEYNRKCTKVIGSEMTYQFYIPIARHT